MKYLFAPPQKWSMSVFLCFEVDAPVDMSRLDYACPCLLREKRRGGRMFFVDDCLPNTRDPERVCDSPAPERLRAPDPRLASDRGPVSHAFAVTVSNKEKRCREHTLHNDSM